MITRFMLISPARSGSTMIGATLAGHPQVHMHGEVMGPRHVQTARRAYLPEAVKALSPEEFSRTMLLERSRNTRRFIQETLFVAGGKKKAVGFKLLLDQALSMHFADAFLWLAEQKEVRIIWLERRNHLARYASRLLLKFKEGRGEGRCTVWAKDELPAQLTTEVDPDEFQQDICNQEAAMKIIRERFDGHPCLDIVYEDIAKDPNAGYKNIFSFLNVDDAVQPCIATRKVNSADLSKVISNLAAIRSHAAISPFLD
jgi:hypothetical protein